MIQLPQCVLYFIRVNSRDSRAMSAVCLPESEVLSMSVQSVTPVLNVSSIGASFEWFELLGWERGFSWNSAGMIGEGVHALGANEHGPAGFGSVCSNGATIFLCRGAQGSRGTIYPRFPGDDATDGVWMTWWMESPDDVDALYAAAVQSGMAVTQPPTDEPWGVREFHLRHPDGHTFRVSAGLESAEEEVEGGELSVE
jgi:hypothetical protein